MDLGDLVLLRESQYNKVFYVIINSFKKENGTRAFMLFPLRSKEYFRESSSGFIKCNEDEIILAEEYVKLLSTKQHEANLEHAKKTLKSWL